MENYLTKAELKLMEVIWEKGQISSNKLVKECLERFNWKKSTTYTNLKKLVDKKMVCNSEAVITVLKSRADYEIGQRKEVIKEYFSNSLPQFVLSFIKERNLTREDIQELEKVIDEYKEELHE